MALLQQVITNDGLQFISEEFQVFIKKNRIKYTCCAPYHTSSNRAVEQFNQIIKQYLRASEKNGRALSHYLPDIL